MKKTSPQPTAPEKDYVGEQVENFTDFNGISTKSLELGLWIAEHRRAFFLAVIWFLSLTAAVLWSFCLYYFANYLIVGIKQDRESAIGMIDGTISHKVIDYESGLSWSFVKAVDNGQGRFDLIGEVTNKNQDAYLNFDYYFEVDGQQSPIKSGFIFPNDTKQIAFLGYAYSGYPSNVRLVVSGSNFKRFNKRNMPDWPQFRDDHLYFLVKDKQFTPYNQTGLSEKVNLNRLNFNITNRSAYSYQDARFLILLYDRDSIVGVDYYVIPEFRSKNTYRAELTEIGDLSAVTHFEVLPDIDIINGSAYIGQTY